MAREPKKKKPVERRDITPKAKEPAALPAIDWAADDDDFDPDFTYNEAIRIVREECPNITKVPAPLEREVRAYIQAIDDDKPKVREAQGELLATLEEMQGDEVSARQAIGKIFRMVDGGIIGKPQESRPEKKRRLLAQTEEAIAGRIDAIAGEFSGAEHKKTAKALRTLAKSFHDGNHDGTTRELLQFVVESALDGTLPQAADAAHYERLRREAADHIMQEVLDGRMALANRVMNEAVLAGAQEVTAELVGGKGR